MTSDSTEGGRDRDKFKNVSSSVEIEKPNAPPTPRQNRSRRSGKGSPRDDSSCTAGFTSLHTLTAYTKSDNLAQTPLNRIGGFSAFKVLKHILSPNYHNSPTYGIPTASTIRSLYRNIKPRERKRLHPVDFSCMINIFGGFSAVPESKERPYGLGSTSELLYKIIAREQELKKDLTPYWEHVITLAQDKGRYLKAELTSSDSYWVLRAELAGLRSQEGDEGLYRASRASSPKTYLVLSISAVHPDRTRIFESARQRLVNHPTQIARSDILIVFVGILLDSGIVDERDEGIRWLCEALPILPGCRRTVLALLWKGIIGSREEMNRDTMARIVDAIRQRLRRPTEESTEVPRIGNGFSVEDHTLDWLTPARLVEYAQERIFATYRSKGLPKLQAWTNQVVDSVFFNDGEENAYGNLVLLGTAVTSPLSITPTTFATFTSKITPLSSDFRVVLVLTILERLVHDDGKRSFEALHEDDCALVGPLLTIIWDQWISAHSERPLLVSRIVLASFLYLAGRARDPLMVQSCWEYSTTHDLVKAGIQDAKPYLAVEYVLAAIGAGSAPQGVLSVLHESGISGASQSWTMDQVVRRIARHNSVLAHDISLVTQKLGVDHGGTTIIELATALQQSGQPDRAFPMLDLLTNDSQKLLLVGEFIRNNCLQPGSITSASASQVANAIIKLPSPSLRKHFPRPGTGWALVGLAKAGVARLAIDAAIHIARREPSWHLPSVYTHLFKYAITQRQFRAAYRLYRTARKGHPESSQIWCRYLVQQFSRAGASVLAKDLSQHIDHHRGRTRGVPIDIAKHLAYREFKPDRNRTLGLPRFVTLPKSTWARAAAVQVIQILMRVRRTPVSLEVYNNVRKMSSPAIQTAMGNTILNGKLRRKSQRDTMRTCIRVLNHLISETGFVPDRVTVNILIKAVLLWRTRVNTYAVRALFDKVVRLGYPTGGVVPEGEVLFGNDGGPIVNEVVLPNLETRIDYKRHVEPLYKMFAKAMYLRGDFAGGLKVVGIMKLVRKEDEKRRAEARERRSSTMVKTTRTRRRKRVRVVDSQGEEGDEPDVGHSSSEEVVADTVS